MKLIKFDIQNFRNITNDNEINFKNYSVLVGRNNEGKTTVLMALRLAINTLKLHSLLKPKRAVTFRSRNGYDWERDFPISLQKKSRGNKNTVFKLYFKLTEDEQVEFRKETGSRNNGDLCIQITFDTNNKFEFLIPKKGSSSLSNKSNQIAEYIARKIQFTYIPAVRTEQEAVSVINEMIEEELEKLEQDNDYQQALAVIENLQQPVLDNVAQSIQISLHKFLPNINNVELSILTNNRRANLRKDYLIEIDDGDLTDIKFKGDGVKSLTAIGLLKDRNKIVNGASIIAIEEPESHLHPSAMHELRQAIQDLTKDSQVVVSTHNPIFVDREFISNNLLVSNNKVRTVKKIKEIRECLGIRTSDNLIHANKMILVEGESDKKIITKIIQERSVKLSRRIKDGDLNIFSLDSASKLSYHLKWFQDQLCSCFVILDKDQAGKESVNKHLASKELDQKSYSLVAVKGLNESELENLINIDFYSEIIVDKFGIDILSTDFTKKKSKWSDALMEILSNSGKSVCLKDLDDLKKSIAEKAEKENIYEYIYAHNKSFVDGLISQLESYFVKE